MELFSSPAFSFRSVENQQNTGAIKKINTGKVLQRKPFSDRPVNSKTPMANKSKEQLMKPQLKGAWNKQVKPEEEYDAHEFIFSFKDKEDYDCDFRQESLFSNEDIKKILRSCYECNQKTPPPSPLAADVKIEPMFLDLPKNEFNFEHNKLCFEIDEIDIPVLDESFF